ncbi:GNAT family N-acetyltransferase [Nesterenkonia ebinurensis]|uniref:GNAT family N-acetyltransferase n=1 Tax=Nesterenkonia ebinurensis TaxID=2608252 RepID=UPI00123C958E|nr:GNAT family N-acetyltransferase [Nesterenkonia ebinurensis]
MNTEYTPKKPQVSPLAEGLVSRTLPAALGADGKPDAASAAFARAVGYGFYEPWHSDEQLERVVPTFAEDGQELTGVYVDPGFASLEPWGETLEQLGFDAEHPVGTFADFDKTLNAGGAEPIEARLITDVTVSASFRRRGILKHMMTSRLAQAVEDGLPLAALTVSEGSIYGRFGFGAATREQGLQINATTAGDGFALRTPAAGTVLTVDPSKTAELLKETFARFHAGTRGSVERTPWYWKAGSGRWDPENITSWNRKVRTIVHVRDDGSIGGYAAFRFMGWDTEPHTMRVLDLIAVDASSRIELIRHLASMDIVQRLTLPRQEAGEDPLAAALVNPRARKVTDENDVLWLRILNPVTALQARAWGADGQFSLSITDSLGICAGTFVVSISDGAAQVSSTQGTTTPQHFSLDVETLGSLYLGDISVLTMREAGRITADDDADWGALSATFDLPTKPYCATHF